MTPDAAARKRMIATFDMDATNAAWALDCAAQPDAAGSGLRRLDRRLQGPYQPVVCAA